MFFYDPEQWEIPPTLQGSLHSVSDDPGEGDSRNPIGFIWPGCGGAGEVQQDEEQGRYVCGACRAPSAFWRPCCAVCGTRNFMVRAEQ